MTEMQFQAVIRRPIAEVFKLIADLTHYDNWLPPSNLYGSVTQYSELPIGRGTQYVDRGRFTRMAGRITEFEPPQHIHFRQSTNSLFGALDVEVRYTLTPIGDYTTRVTRAVRVETTGGYGLLKGTLLESIRAESERILAAMKAWLEDS